jgi:hypothetical protein
MVKETSGEVSACSWGGGRRRRGAQRRPPRSDFHHGEDLARVCSVRERTGSRRDVDAPASPS